MLTKDQIHFYKHLDKYTLIKIKTNYFVKYPIIVIGVKLKKLTLNKTNINNFKIYFK